MNGIKAQLMAALVGMIMKLLSPELLKQFIDIVLDFVEDKVEGSASTIGMGSAWRYQKETARYLGAPLWMARKRHMS